MSVRVRMIAPAEGSTLQKVDHLPEAAVTWAVSARRGEIEVAEGLFAQVVGYRFRSSTAEHVLYLAELPRGVPGWRENLLFWKTLGWAELGDSSGS